MMKTIFALAVSGLLVVFPALGQEAPPAFQRSETEEAAVEEHDPFDPALNAPKLVRVQVEYIEMPHKDLTRLMMEDKAVTADATELRMKVQALVEKEQAQVMETQIVVCRSGQKAETGSTHEFIYPTEYVPFKYLPNNVVGTEKSDAAPPAYVSSPATPTAFETRNLGSTLEAEPTIGADDKVIDLRFLPDLVWHTGNTEWFEHKDERGNITKVIMPGFYRLALNTSITCLSGQYTMVGVHSPKNEKGEVDRDRKIMVFVKCDVLAVIP